MTNQKDRHLEAPGEANRDKHINFLAEENGDVDPASENFTEDDAADTEDVDNGFFTNDDDKLHTREAPFEPGTTTSTEPYVNEDDEAH